ncbi:hypothetical protein RRG08_022992 [Elysia crispata]|uniref:Schwannomin interacting protein 1 C-terminal domain-containing protein n=1 Tax=Elysia crispata TaxID=231223 RepID=A0AAE1AFZ1_9GAST|nr:hypothetical protein RRG08_022992 [Elysia crispata]
MREYPNTLALNIFFLLALAWTNLLFATNLKAIFEKRDDCFTRLVKKTCESNFESASHNSKTPQPSCVVYCIRGAEVECGMFQSRSIRSSHVGESSGPPHPNHPCLAGDVERFTSRQSQLQTEATLALAQASTMARMQLEVEKQNKKKSPIADMVGIPTLGNGRRLRLSRAKLHEMSLGQLQVLVNDLHSQIELLNEDLVHLLIERDDLHMEQDSMLVDIEDLTSHCQDPAATNNNKSTQNKNRPTSRRDRHK